MTSNAVIGVRSSRRAPITPPRNVASSKLRSETGPTGPKPSRYVHALVSCPGNSATVLVVFAVTEGTPTAINAGKVTNEPPPASAFIMPAIRPAPATSSSGLTAAIVRYFMASARGG